MLAPTARVLRDGEPVVVSARELVPGDIMLLEAGDRVSADIRLLEAHALYCDEAPFTGESTPVAKQAAVLPKNTSIPERTNTLFGGTIVTYGRGKGVVTDDHHTPQNRRNGRVHEGRTGSSPASMQIHLRR